MGITRPLREYYLCNASKQPPTSCVGTLYIPWYLRFSDDFVLRLNILHFSMLAILCCTKTVQVWWKWHVWRFQKSCAESMPATVLKQALSVLMLCAPVFIFTSGSSALLGCPRCGLSIWLSPLAISNTLFWVYVNFLRENRQNMKIQDMKSAIFVRYENGRQGLLSAQSINTERASLSCHGYRAKFWSNTWMKHITEKNKPSLVSAPIFRVTDQSTLKCHHFENCNFYKDLYGERARHACSAHLPYKTFAILWCMTLTTGPLTNFGLLFPVVWFVFVSGQAL